MAIVALVSPQLPILPDRRALLAIFQQVTGHGTMIDDQRSLSSKCLARARARLFTMGSKKIGTLPDWA